MPLPDRDGPPRTRPKQTNILVGVAVAVLACGTGALASRQEHACAVSLEKVREAIERKDYTVARDELGEARESCRRVQSGEQKRLALVIDEEQKRADASPLSPLPGAPSTPIPASASPTATPRE